MRAVNIKVEHLLNPIGIDIKNPMISWQCEDGIKQTGYELKAMSEGKEIFYSGKAATCAMSARLEVELASRQKVALGLRLWDEKNEPGEWNEVAFFEMGLLEKKDFCAKWINPELECDPSIHKPASYLRRTFQVDKLGDARLYITAHGLYETYINGKRVGEFVLAPGSYNYDKRLAYQTYDVSELICKGENEIQVILGDGWYRSVSGVDGDRNLYGEGVALLAQLEVDKEVVCITDESWVAAQDGPILENDMQQGELVDLTIEGPKEYHSVKIENNGYETLICSNTVQIKEKERFEGKLMTTPSGQRVIDFGQNLAGYIELKVTAQRGQKLVLTTGETLDENGNFTQENFQDRKRHKEGGTKQMLTVVCKEGVNVYKPKFTIWGFRYALIETDVDLENASFTSIAVYSDMEELASFKCSNEDINQLVSNAMWSMKSNFCDVPTDCPTRERAAWTGDMGVFIETGLTLMDSYTVVRKWLKECQLAQYPDGKLANIAPRNNNPSFFSGLLAGSVGWGDACIIVPYAMYKRYQDKEILAENYEMMKAWYGFLEGRAKAKPLNPIKRFKSKPYRDYTIETGIDYGEWCEPDVESTNAMRTPQGKVATAYFARSGQLLSEIAEILGYSEDAIRYRKIAQKARQAFRNIATDNGKICSDRQAEYVRAITFNLLEEQEKKQAAADLNQLVVDNAFHLNTGFLSTPDLCKVLADYGYEETAYRVLLQDTMPGWLYSVKKGATTIWETWNGIDENGIPHESLNHYSKGAIVNWLITGICGISVCNNKIVIAPKPNKAIESASATYFSPIGKIQAEYSYEGENVKFVVQIPANGEAAFLMPNGEKRTLLPGKHEIAYK